MISMRGGKPIQERTGRELLVLFVIIPVSVGIAALSALILAVKNSGGTLHGEHWFGVAWGVCLALSLIGVLPAAAWHEWKRRKQFPRRNSQDRSGSSNPTVIN